MVLAQIAGGSSGVEIAEGGVPQAVDAVKPGEHLLDQQFGLSIGVRGAQRVGVFNGRAAVRAVKLRGDDAADIPGSSSNQNAIGHVAFSLQRQSFDLVRKPKDYIKNRAPAPA